MESKRADQVKVGDAIVVGGNRRVVTEVLSHPNGVQLGLEPMARKASHTVRKADAMVQLDSAPEPDPTEPEPTKTPRRKFELSKQEVAAIAKQLRDGARFKDVRDAHGLSNGQPLRRALYAAGFDTKGAKNPDGLTARELRARTAAATPTGEEA